jgi:hypothetical protein
MATSAFKIDEFRTQVLTRGMMKPNRFEVIINPPSCVGGASLQSTNSGQGNTGTADAGRLVSLFADTASLPQTRINVASQRLFGPPTFHAQNADYGGDNISLTFYVDRDMQVKRFFDTWVDGIVDRQKGTVSYLADYATSMTVNQLDETDTITYSVKFEDLFPISVAPIQLDQNSMNQAGKLTVTFCYRRWDWDKEPPPKKAAPYAPDYTPEPKRVNYTGQEVQEANDYGQSFGVGQLSG